MNKIKFITPDLNFNNNKWIGNINFNYLNNLMNK